MSHSWSKDELTKVFLIHCIYDTQREINMRDIHKPVDIKAVIKMMETINKKDGPILKTL